MGAGLPAVAPYKKRNWYSAGAYGCRDSLSFNYTTFSAFPQRIFPIFLFFRVLAVIIHKNSRRFFYLLPKGRIVEILAPVWYN